jgi:hypothetical protein
VDGPGARTILHVIGHERSWEHEGARLLAVIMTSLGDQSVEVWPAGLSGFSSAKGENGLLLHVTH